MFHYLFTNDLRISSLKKSLIEASKCYIEDSVPKASEDKNANNNMNTLGFYFNLTIDSNCAKQCAKGNVREVILNFIKKFQFPNPRTTESLQDAVNDGIIVAPLRIIVQVLYFMNMINKNEAYLTDKEIADYIFFNEEIAKNSTPNVLNLATKIINSRNEDSDSSIASDEKLAEKGYYWKQCKRQIREMVNVLTWSGCIERVSDRKIEIHHDNLTKENRATIFEILSYSDYWIPDNNKNANENKESYQKYMDIEETIENKEEEDMEEDYTEQELGKILNEYYNDESSGKVTGIFLFGIKYGQLIKNKDYNRRNIILEAQIQESYLTELNKGICLSDYAKIIDNNSQNVVEEIDDSDRIKGGDNLIYYGVPGTGKSHKIDKKLKDVNEENIFRVTIHPEYTYNDFIGQLLPKVEKVGDDEKITYSFQKGVFTKALERAYDKPKEAVYLVMEEMSRGNCAAIFGDIFQLLDRVKVGNDKDWSRYSVYNEIIAKNIKRIKNNRIKIPSNMYIWGTVNTSDQNVFVMDNAFKRRFDWEYTSTKPVKENEEYLNNVDINLNNGSTMVSINWIQLYQILNKYISSSNKLGLGEDKQIGQFFIEFDGVNNKEKIKNKLLHYLWFDIQEASYKTEIKLFDETITSFSDLYEKYEVDGKIFSDNFFECIEAWKNNIL